MPKLNLESFERYEDRNENLYDSRHEVDVRRSREIRGEFNQVKNHRQEKHIDRSCKFAMRGGRGR